MSHDLQEAIGKDCKFRCLDDPHDLLKICYDFRLRSITRLVKPYRQVKIVCDPEKARKVVQEPGATR